MDTLSTSLDVFLEKPSQLQEREIGSRARMHARLFFSLVKCKAPLLIAMRFQASHQPSNLSVVMNFQSRVAICWILVFLSFLLSIIVLYAGTKPNFLPDASLVNVTSHLANSGRLISTNTRTLMGYGHGVTRLRRATACGAYAYTLSVRVY
jgi:hypothetical protein